MSLFSSILSPVAALSSPGAAGHQCFGRRISQYHCVNPLIIAFLKKKMVKLNRVGFLSLVGVAVARHGVDLSVTTDETTWKCLMSEHNTTYAFVRVYRSVGQLDANAPDSIKSAWGAGLLNLHAYVFPCVSTSPYSIQNGIVCDSPADQIKKSVSFLEDNGIHVVRQGETPSSTDANVRRLWLDIEGI
jgi:hypothetical protein